MIRCPDHDYHLKPDGCPMCRALKAEAELESLRQENSRLREALKEIDDIRKRGGLLYELLAKASDIAHDALNPPKNR